VTVEAALGHHNVIATTVPQGFLEKQAAALDTASLQTPPTPAEQQQLDAIRARGSRDPKIAEQGVINYTCSRSATASICCLPTAPDRSPTASARSSRRSRPLTSRCSPTSPSMPAFRRSSIS
jgi:hypothetical protein